MDKLAGFTLEQGRAFYRPIGTVSFDAAVELVRVAIESALSNHVAELLVDTTALVGFDSPTTFQRFVAVADWANAAKGRVRLALVARPEMIDRQKFGVVVGLNREFVNNIFPTEALARSWLDAHGGSNLIAAANGPKVTSPG